MSAVTQEEVLQNGTGHGNSRTGKINRNVANKIETEINKYMDKWMNKYIYINKKGIKFMRN